MISRFLVVFFLYIVFAPSFVISKESTGQLHDSLQSIITSEFDKFPGKVSALVVKNEKEKLSERSSQEPMAIGSTFKLYILKALLEEIEHGKESWKRVIPLREEWKSYPSGLLQEWPDQSPVTLHTLASQMISISDNTATDHLLFYLGRKRVEEGTLRNRPFLSTRELFQLKWGKGEKWVGGYLKRDEKGKRKILAKIDKLPLESSITEKVKGPKYVDTLEWFATTGELCSLISFMKGEPILSINPTVLLKKGEWGYVGYKGGSEPGVLQMTYILQSKKKNWYCVSMTWNNEREVLEEDKFFIVVGRVLELLRKE